MPGRFEPYLFTGRTPYRWLLCLIFIHLGIAGFLTLRAGFRGYFWYPTPIQFALLYVVYRDLGTGQAWVRSDTIYRKSQPMRYWFSIGMVILFYLAATAWPIQMYIQEKAKE